MTDIPVVPDEVTPSPFLKLNRARDLYKEIHDAAQEIINRETRYNAFEYGRYPKVSDALVWQRSPDPHPEVGILAGELVHEVRSSLDHLVNELISESGATNDEAQYPIHSSASRWEAQVEKRGAGGTVCASCGLKSSRPSPLFGLSDEQVNYIKDTQPFNVEAIERRSHSLYQLVEISNQDKHRALHTCAVLVRTPARITYQPEGFYEVGDVEFKGSDLVEGGAEFARVTRMVIREPKVRLGVQVRVVGDADVAFRAGEEEPVATVQDLGRMILRAVEIHRVLSPISPHREIGA
jgi:hypothetical protein